MDSIIEVKNLSLTIRNTEILKDINLSLARGEIHGFVGRNGSGKTMLMKCICGFVLPTSGIIVVDGKQIGKDADFPTSVGILIETPGFSPYLSGFQNLKRLADLTGKAKKEDICAAMQRVGLDADLKRSVRKYSLGMRQRLGIAQAILDDPDLFILDEPFNGLDEEGVAAMRSFFQELRQKGKTIVLSSHNAEDIEVLCSHVYRMEHGMLHQIR